MCAIFRRRLRSVLTGGGLRESSGIPGENGSGQTRLEGCGPRPNVARAQRSTKWCAADPGSYRTPSLRRSRIRGAQDSGAEACREANRRVLGREGVGATICIEDAGRRFSGGNVPSKVASPPGD